jgi:hypothetical protein
MTEKKSDTTAAAQRGPFAAPFVTGISPAVKDQIDKLGVTPEIKRRILEHVAKKG